MFKVNEGKTDRIIRVVLGFVMLAIGIIKMWTLLIVLGAILLATGITGFCGLYAILGINTCKIKNKN